ncbi:hypothetical protein BHE74_00016264 [Ensete ventricosum]|nr:hypothetical protein BHE74_00016264 [Ensete ventricosum]
MDNKIKAMIRLIEEDADSFAKRAEMYYKKRPELIKLVEEFYRAYRALAERYDHATGALHQARRTIAEAFPDEIPLEFCDEPPCGYLVSDTGMDNPETSEESFSRDRIQHDVFGLPGEVLKLNEVYSGETEVTSTEVCLKQFNEIFVTNTNNENFAGGREGKSSEYKLLQKEISRLFNENQDLKKQVTSESARAEKNENEVQLLKEMCFKVKSEKEDALTRYEESLVKVSFLEDETSRTKTDLKKLNDEMLTAASCLNIAEERNLVLEKANLSLQLELDVLNQKIIAQQEALNKKGQELEILYISLQDEQQRNVDAEITCQSIEERHTRSQEEMRHLKLENKSGAEKLKNVEEELQTISEENDRLNEQKLSSALKIMDLQDEIISLIDMKRKLEDEADLHIEEKEALQLELCRLKKDRNDMEQKYNALIEEIQAVNLCKESLQSLIKDLRKRNLDLKEAIKKTEDERTLYLEKLDHMQTTTKDNAVLEASLLDANDMEKDSKLDCVAELQELLRLEKEEHSTLIQSSTSQLSMLANLIYVLQEGGQEREEDFEMENYKIMNAQIEIFILQRCLCDIKEENLLLSVGSQKHQEALRCAEKHILELEQKCLTKEKNIKSFTKHNEKLREWIHLIAKSLKINLQYISLDVIKDEGLLQLVFDEIRRMLHTISEAQDEKQHLLLEKSVVVTLLEQLGKYVEDLRAEKTLLDRECKIRLEEFTLLKCKNDELFEMNKQLTKEMQTSNQREEALRTEVDDDQVDPFPCTTNNEETSQDYNVTKPTGLLRLKCLHDKVKVLQEVMMNTGSILELERFDSDASLEVAWKEIEGLKSKGNRHKRTTKSKYEQILKDIQLDFVLNSSSYENGEPRETDETMDRMLQLWGAAEGYDSWKKKSPMITENSTTDNQIEENEGEYTSGELEAEKELDVDKLEQPKNSATHQEWNKRVIERLFSDAQRLVILEASLHELQKNMERSLKVSRLTRSEFNGINIQLKEAEGSIIQLIEVNSKLTSKVEVLSASLHDQTTEKDNGSKRQKQISDWARKVSEKIGRLELEMPNIQFRLLKFEEEHANKRAKVAKRRSAIRLREYIYGRKNSRRQKESSSCGCMRPTTSD